MIGGRRGVIILLGVLQTLGTMTVDLYLPAFPLIAAELRASDFDLQATFSAAMVGMLCGALLGGALSDRVGRRPVLLVSTALHAAGSIVCALSWTVPVLVAGRFVQGVTAAAISAAILACVRDLYSGARMLRTLAAMAVISGIAIAAGPSIGAAMLRIMDWHLVFATLAAYALVLLLAGMVVLPETHAAHLRRGATALQAARRLAGDRVFIGLALTGGFIWAAQYAYLASSSLIFQQHFGLSESGYGVVFAAHALCMLLGTQLGALAARRVRPIRVLAVCCGGVAVLTAALALASAAGAGLVPTTILLCSFTGMLGAINPSLQSLALAGHGPIAGSAASLLSSLSLLFGAASSVIPSLFGGGTPVAVTGVMAACGILGAACLLVVVAPAGRGMPSEWSTE
ncbi:Bcr/CflA family efflux MFS transporter [Microbacterium sp.]|uniref:Bcr/CflA family efflux MFS transporter n=1 Tax=Microbacterium sp. TaxID=51671 RepID=UPI003340D6FE